MLNTSKELNQIINKAKLFNQKTGVDFLRLTQNGKISPGVREYLVGLIMQLCAVKNSSKAAEQLGVYYLDFTLCLKAFPTGAFLELLAFTCASLALKYEDSREVSLNELADLTEHKFSIRNIQMTEMYILQLLDWQLDLVTPFTVVRNVIEGHFSLADSEALAEESCKYVNAALKDYETSRNSAFHIGVAAILSSFKALDKVENSNEWLQKVVGISEDLKHIEILSEMIWEVVNSNKN